MLVWIGIGWTLLAILAAWVWSRLPRGGSVPTEVRNFLDDVRTEVARRNDITWRGFVPGRFSAVLSVDDQDTPVALHPLFHEYASRRAPLSVLISRLVQEIREEGLDLTVDHPFSEIAGDILPQVRSEKWLAEHGPAFGDGALVRKPLGEDLWILYVIDLSWSMVFITQRHLREWGCTGDAVHQLALRNLAALSAVSPVRTPTELGEPAVLTRQGDGYDAARLLLLDGERTEGLLVAVPERDTLWLGSADVQGGDDELAKLLALNEEQCARSEHPISPRVYRFESGRLVVVRGE